MRIQPVVIAVIRKENKFLLTKRIFFDDEDKSFGPFAWNLPGGGLEFGESPMQALEREMKEELALDVKVGQLIPEVYSEVRNHWQGIFLTFICEMSDPSQEIVLNEEASEYGWFSLEEVKNLKTLPKTVEILNMASKIS